MTISIRKSLETIHFHELSVFLICRKKQSVNLLNCNSQTKIFNSSYFTLQIYEMQTSTYSGGQVYPNGTSACILCQPEMKQNFEISSFN